MQSLCHRFVVCFTIIIWSFGVAAAQHDVPPQNHNIKAAENAAICAAFAKIMGLQTSLYPKAAKQWHGRQHHATNQMRDIAIQNGRQDIDQQDIDMITARYASWILGRLTNDDHQIDQNAFQKTGKLIGQTCTKIFYHADLSSLKQAAANPNTDKDASIPRPETPHDDPMVITMVRKSIPPINQQMIKPRSSETGYHVDLGTFRTLFAAKRASRQLQHWLGQNAINLWLHITPVTVDGRAGLRLHSDTLQLDESKRLCTIAWAAQQACVLTPSDPPPLSPAWH
ncbi:hypothetical protein N9L23_00520 [Alphaproteobacteria bacterium]|nr:hypothetical protein [Alphaproteobacteria bacterium]